VEASVSLTAEQMQYQNVCVEAFTCLLPPNVVTSEQLEGRLRPVYDRLGLHPGRLELMTGIRERRHFDPDARPGMISAKTAKRAIAMSGIDPNDIGVLIHGSVCRDQMEPATACSVHNAVGLPPHALAMDISNACLGLLNGMVIIANMIELGQIRAGVVVGTEIGLPLVEGTIDRLLADPNVTRQSLKLELASLTIGSSSAAVILCDKELSRTGTRLVGGACLADTSSHELCAGGDSTLSCGDARPQMSTDSEALLYAGVTLATRTWAEMKRSIGWHNEDVDKVFTHQVGKAHRKLLLERLGLREELDYPTVELLGNTGAAALPTAVALGVGAGHVSPGDRVALLGIGSGLNSVMLGLEWGRIAL
jgi:3-oxoacyl-[acyl-carrier-protein] synthase III